MQPLILEPLGVDGPLHVVLQRRGARNRTAQGAAASAAQRRSRAAVGLGERAAAREFGPRPRLLRSGTGRTGRAIAGWRRRCAIR
eukprot:4259355-Prymnesium_polylepis.2